MTVTRTALSAIGLFASVALAAATFAVPGPAEANGGGSTSGSSSGSNTRTLGTPKCPAGWKYVPETKKCARETSGLIQELPAVGWADTDPAFVEAAVLAHSARYDQAIAAFNALGRPDDPYVLNYLGFSHRKLGQVESALAYYHKALSIQPDYIRAREYLGEGYVALGRIDEAREQLALIAQQCGTGCEEYKTLERGIAAHISAGG